MVESVDQDLTAIRLTVAVAGCFVESGRVGFPPRCEFGWVRPGQSFIRVFGKVVVSPFLWLRGRRSGSDQLFLFQIQSRNTSDRLAS